ncbi:hypothetical protein KC722_02735 [Candidatus Kaiserbacteria bacterium]|nr:hypothetical protein [Candidatus Kaiserbacteria bacterium]MCB9811644.1 hypothetical protein [Candidatus Nomurabacteria bacterium]
MSPIRVQKVTAPRILKTIFLCALIGSAALYIMFQARLLISGPSLTLTNEPSVTQTERRITLSGSAKNITEIYLNGRPISTDEAGDFTESVVLENGHTLVRVSAKDRYGRETSIERSFVYTPYSSLN